MSADTATRRPTGVWDRIWFAPERPLTLEAARWLVFGALAIDIATRRSVYRDVADGPAELWEPTSVLGLVPLAQPGPVVIEVLLWVVWLGVAATLLRLAPRVTGLLAAGAGTALVMLANSFGKVDHDQQILVIMAVVLAVAAIPRLGEAASGRFRWPVQLCRAAFAVMLLSASIAKLRDSGLDWVFTENMRNILVMDNLLGAAPPMQSLALWIAAEPVLWQGAAAATIVGEAALVLAVVARHPLVRIPAVVAGVGTVVGITLLLGLVGFPAVALAAIFVELGDHARRAETGGAAWWHRLLVPAAGLVVLALAGATDAPGGAAALPLVAYAAIAGVGLAHLRGAAPIPDRWAGRWT